MTAKVVKRKEPVREPVAIIRNGKLFLNSLDGDTLNSVYCLEGSTLYPNGGCKLNKLTGGVTKLYAGDTIEITL